MIRISTRSASRRQEPSWRRSCQRRSMRRSCSWFHAAPSFPAFGSTPYASSLNLPGGLDVRLVGAIRAAEHERLGNRVLIAGEDCRQAPVRVERNSPGLLVLRVPAGNPDLTGIPVHALVLNHQHLAATAAELQRPDDLERTRDQLLALGFLLKRAKTCAAD
jgi:hypothetical protein